MSELQDQDPIFKIAVINYPSFYVFKPHSDVAHDELSTLQTSLLLDEFHQPVKSKVDYLKSIQHVFNLFPNY